MLCLILFMTAVFKIKSIKLDSKASFLSHAVMEPGKIYSRCNLKQPQKLFFHQTWNRSAQSAEVVTKS